MSDIPQDNLTPDQLDEELTAYLDGELEPAAARRLEDRLAMDAHSRRRLNQLAASWDMLDQLPRAMVDDGFTRTTVEMVALTAEHDIAEVESAAPARARRHWTLGLVAALVAAAVGFAAVAVALPDRNEALLRDLPVVKNLEVYRQVGDIDFARRLNTDRLFGDDGPDRQNRDAPADFETETIGESIAEYRAWVDALDPARKTELRRSFEKFTALPADQRQALRVLDEQLRADPNTEQLDRAIHRYHDWLKNRSPTDRAELAEQPDGESKIRLVTRLRREQQAARFSGGWPTMRENPVGRWLAQFARDHEQELITALTPEQREGFERLTEPQRSMRLMSFAWVRWWQPQAEHMPPVTEDDLRSIRQHLPPEVQQKMGDASTTEAQVVLLRQWLLDDFRARFPRGFGGGGRGPSPERLRRFYEKQLSPEEQQRLILMPEHEKNRELGQLYDKWRRSQDGSRSGRNRERGNDHDVDDRDRDRRMRDRDENSNEPPSMPATPDSPAEPKSASGLGDSR